MDLVHFHTASVDVTTRATIAAFARKTPLERIVAEAAAVAAELAPDASVR